jgi:CBS domain-containing protein
MKIGDVMSTGLATVAPGDTLEAAARKMGDENVGSLPVAEEGRLVGIITDRDIAVRAVAKGATADSPVSAFMTAEVVTCSPDASVAEASDLMRENQIRRLYVVDEGSLAGVASLGDLALEAPGLDAGETLREISKD